MPYAGYAFILLVCAVVALVAFGKVGSKAYPYLLYGIAAGMVLMTTLAGPHLVGSDIHIEYYYAQLYSGGDVWPSLWHIVQETAIANTYIAPLIHKALHIPLLWVYKVVFPLMFASVPVLLYFIYRKWLNEKNAFLAAMFFIAFPAFLLELPTIARQMVAEVFLAAFLYLILVSNLRLRYKAPLAACCGMLAILTHLATGIIILILLTVSFFAKPLLRIREGLPTLVTGAILVVLLAGSIAYFSNAASGAAIYKLGGLYDSFAPEAYELNLQMAPKNTVAPQPIGQTIYDPTEPEAQEEGATVGPTEPEAQGEETTVRSTPPWYARYETLMKAGLGFDFLESSALGKLFRILQWAVILLIPIGLWLMRKTKGYWLFASGSIVILALCLIPGFSSILNITRFFHLALFLIAPALVVGGLWVCRKPQTLALIVLIPYFLLTSGFIFEVTQQKDVSKPNMPYSIALSDHRMDLSATFTGNDLAVRDWIAENQTTFPIYGDQFGVLLIAEVIGQRPGINIKLPRSAGERPDPPFYLFVRERNAWDNLFTVWAGVGCRRYVTPESYGIDIDENIIYRVGDARVLEVR